MKRARTISKSTENVVVGSKDEPPVKKIAKKRVKSVTQTTAPQSQTGSSVVTASSAPGVKHGAPFHSILKLGSLPMYGEHLPVEGSSCIPKLAEKTCDNLRVIMSKVRECKLKGGNKVSSNLTVSYWLIEILFSQMLKLNYLSKKG